MTVVQRHKGRAGDGNSRLTQPDCANSAAHAFPVVESAVDCPRGTTEQPESLSSPFAKSLQKRSIPWRDDTESTPVANANRKKFPFSS
jgi:hypothetical protein